MAKLSSDGKSVTVEKGDTLWGIAETHLGSGAKYTQLAAINNLSNPDLIAIGQVIKLTSDGSSSTPTSSSSNAPTINQFGLISDSDNTLFATWTWGKSNTESYKVLWTYDTGNGVWFGNPTTITVDEDAPELSRQSTFQIPDNAKRVRFKVKPISKTKPTTGSQTSSNGIIYYDTSKNGGGNTSTSTSYWTANWSGVETHAVAENPPDVPSVPTVTIDKYKLTAELDNLDAGATGIQFQVVKNNSATAFKTAKATITSGYASYSCTVDAGGEYKVRCRAYKDNLYSEWSNYSSNISTIPAASSGITTIRASSETAVYLEWSAADSATSYDIEYTTKKEYFDGSDQTTTISSVESTHYEKTGLESGTEYFFRVRAVNSKGESAWSGIKSIIIGKIPAAPTTWSSTTTAITGEPLTLYWVHNTEDGSSQTYAELEIYVGGFKETHTIQNTTDEDEKDKTSSYAMDTSGYVEGTQIKWRVRTAGITKTYGDWSVERTIDIYAPATLELRMTDSTGKTVDTLEAFPFYIYGLPGPNTQVPIGYHLSIKANDIYETVDNMGNPKTVNKDEEVYSKYFDIHDALLVEFSPNNIDLENNMSYTVTCTVSMDSGLTTESSVEFSVSWIDVRYQPNAAIGLDVDTLTAFIRPYCEEGVLLNYKVDYVSGVYILSTEQIGAVYGTLLPDVTTSTGERVYSGTTADGEEVYYSIVEDKTMVNDVLLSVYRREFDGGFTELGSNIDISKNTTITDPHPALDYARYRIVATSKTTGAVSYYDPPGYPVGGQAVVIQWDEDWTNFDTSEDVLMEQPAWSGSLLKLPYNIDVSDSNDTDVSLIQYIGRKRPVAYYGTHLGEKATWNVDIDKNDKETLYALRRLAIWMGDVYVREPSGSGYWANIAVSFSQKHNELTIPVTLSITRVEGGA